MHGCNLWSFASYLSFRTHVIFMVVKDTFLLSILSFMIVLLSLVTQLFTKLLQLPSHLCTASIAVEMLTLSSFIFLIPIDLLSMTGRSYSNKLGQCANIQTFQFMTNVYPTQCTDSRTLAHLMWPSKVGTSINMLIQMIFGETICSLMIWEHF